MKMKTYQSLIYCLFAYMFVYPAMASYTYEVYTYGPSKTLHGEENILVDQQGGMDGLTLYGNSTATIQGTSHLEQGSGGIWELDLTGNSYLNFLGGELANLDIGYYATAALSGGLIHQIYSNQYAWKYYHPDGGYPPIPIHDPHIEIICRDWDYDTLTKKLTGTWNVDNNKDGLFDPFNIQLVNVQGYSPAIENIKFTIIPEPATMLLLAAGGLLVRRK